MLIKIEYRRSTIFNAFNLSLDALIFTQGTKHKKREERTLSIEEYFFANRETAGISN